MSIDRYPAVPAAHIPVREKYPAAVAAVSYQPLAFSFEKRANPKYPAVPAAHIPVREKYPAAGTFAEHQEGRGFAIPQQERL
jgi:hypothetical protein